MGTPETCSAELLTDPVARLAQHGGEMRVSFWHEFEEDLLFKAESEGLLRYENGDCFFSASATLTNKGRAFFGLPRSASLWDDHISPLFQRVAKGLFG